METIEIQYHKSRATLWLNRPSRKNAFNPTMIAEITESLDQLNSNRDVRLIVIRGSNNQYCSGADIEWMKQSGEHNDEQNRTESHRIFELLEAIKNCDKPVISWAEGHIYGGAIGLLAVSDWVLADPACQFAFTEARLGIAPAVIMPYVLSRMNPSKARQLMLSSRVFGADEACICGLVDLVLPGRELNSQMDEIEQHIVRNSPQALKEIKRLINLVQQNTPEGVIIELLETLSELKKSHDGQEGLSAFLEKRTAKWQA